jgi:hypothetical protein
MPPHLLACRHGATASSARSTTSRTDPCRKTAARRTPLPGTGNGKAALVTGVRHDNPEIGVPWTRGDGKPRVVRLGGGRQAAAASRAVDALDDTCQTLLSSLGRLAHDEISAQQFTALDTLRREIRPSTPLRNGPGPAGPSRPRGGPVLVACPARRRSRVDHRPAACRRRSRSRLVRAGRRRWQGRPWNRAWSG